MKNQKEYEKRCQAIQLHKEGIKFKKILHLVQRGRFWLSKWLRRYKEGTFKSFMQILLRALFSMVSMVIN
jgi:transposase